MDVETPSPALSAAARRAEIRRRRILESGNDRINKILSGTPAAHVTSSKIHEEHLSHRLSSGTSGDEPSIQKLLNANSGSDEPLHPDIIRPSIEESGVTTESSTRPVLDKDGSCRGLFSLFPPGDIRIISLIIILLSSIFKTNIFMCMLFIESLRIIISSNYLSSLSSVVIINKNNIRALISMIVRDLILITFIYVVIQAVKIHYYSST